MMFNVKLPQQEFLSRRTFGRFFLGMNPKTWKNLRGMSLGKTMDKKPLFFVWCVFGWKAKTDFVCSSMIVLYWKLRNLEWLHQKSIILGDKNAGSHFMGHPQSSPRFCMTWWCNPQHSCGHLHKILGIWLNPHGSFIFPTDSHDIPMMVILSYGHTVSSSIIWRCPKIGLPQII